MDPNMRDTLEVVSTFKQHLLSEHGARDMPPQMRVTIRQTTGEDLVEVAPDFIWQMALAANDDDTARACGGIINTVKHWPDFERFIDVTIVVDTLFTKDQSVYDEYESLEAARARGDERIREALNLFLVYDDLVGGFEYRFAILPYWLDDGGVFVWCWDEATDSDETETDFNSRIVDNVMEAMKS